MLDKSTTISSLTSFTGTRNSPEDKELDVKSSAAGRKPVIGPLGPTIKLPCLGGLAGDTKTEFKLV